MVTFTLGIVAGIACFIVVLAGLVFWVYKSMEGIDERKQRW